MIRLASALVALTLFSPRIGGGQETAHASDGFPAMISTQSIGAVEINRPIFLVQHSLPVRQEVADSSRHLWKWLLGGMAIGGAIGGGGAALLAVRHCRSSDSCMLAGPAVIAGGTVGAILGGFVGLLGYADPYPNEAHHRRER